MVLLTTLAMQTARPRAHDGQPHGHQPTPVNGYLGHSSAHLNNTFDGSDGRSRSMGLYRNRLSHSMEFTTNDLGGHHNHNRNIIYAAQPRSGRRNSNPNPAGHPTIHENGEDDFEFREKSRRKLGVVSPGMYYSLMNLDEWSPSTVSVSSLLSGKVTKDNEDERPLVNGDRRLSADRGTHASRSHSTERSSHSHRSYSRERGVSADRAFCRRSPREFQDSQQYQQYHQPTFPEQYQPQYQQEQAPRSPTSPSTPASPVKPELVQRSSSGCSQPRPPPPSYAAFMQSNLAKRDRSLRRSVSCDPNQQDMCYQESRPLFGGSPGGSPRGSMVSMPRVHSEGDLESEYVTLDYSYVPSPRRGKPSPYTSAVSSTTSTVTTAASGLESGRSTAAPFHPRSYRSLYSNDSDYIYVNGNSSGYASNSSDSSRMSPGSMNHPALQRSGTMPTKSALKKTYRATSADGALSRSLSSGRGTPPRKKSSQTLQTVAENIIQSLIPGRSGSRQSNDPNGDSTSGADTPRSVSSSRRSSLNSRLGASNDSSSVISSDFALSDTRVTPPSETPSAPVPNGILVNNYSNNYNTATAQNTDTDKLTPDSESSFRKRIRSKSLSDLRAVVNGEAETTYLTGSYSDDEDGDDFGFLSYPFTSMSVSPAMHKPKAATLATTTPSHRLLPRRWRSKTKSGSAPPQPQHPMWSPEGPCTWCSVSGRKVILKPVSILHLSEAERLALQKIALSKLQSMDLACPIVIPKDGSELRRKKRALSIKRRSKSANLSSLLDTLSSEKGKENKDSKSAGLVFGIPLSRCIANDRELAKRRNRAQTASTLQGRTDSSDHLLAPRPGRKSSSSSQGSMDSSAQNGTMTAANPCMLYESARRAASSDSLSESENSSRNTSSSLIDALALPVPAGSRTGGSQSVGSTPQVPHIVDACFKHLETYGLQVLGIFRVGSSKKRVKQLREEFDTGKDVQLTEEHNPHDVGALLKEFFRDLPEPLLTRDLYQAFVATRKIKDREKQAEAIRLLLTLLPPANRDTLWALLRFLATVHRHSADGVDSNGQEIPGNKMDSHNLATLFGPNVLHRARATNEKQFMAECAQQAEQSSEVIGVTKDMIDNHYELFEISASQRDEVLRLMMEADQENLDRVLRRLANENQIEPDPESMCSVFDDSEQYVQSLPHSANSDADLLSLAKRKGVSHSPLRVSRSADPWTDPPQRSAAPSSNPFVEGRRVASLDNAGERLTDSPSPQDSPCTNLTSPRGGVPTITTSPPPSRPPLVTVSQDASSPEVVMRATSGRRRAQEGPVSVTGSVLASGRPGVVVRERPYSETFAGSLSIPQPAYMRENSAGSSSSYLSSSGGHSSQHGGSDSSGHWVLPTPSSTPSPTTPVPPSLAEETVRRTPSSGQSPLPQRHSTTSSIPRRRTTQTSSSRSDDDDGSSPPPVGSPEWQRERWRHWELITAGRNGGGAEQEQETLV